MPRFNSPRDIRFFQQISTELVDDVIETLVTLFKVNVLETAYNLYGESLSKKYYKGMETFCVIDRQDTETNYEGFGSDTMRNSTFRFNRHTLIEADFYPQVGDIVLLDGSYYELSNVREDQWVGGQSESKFSVICEGFLSRNTTIDLEQIVR
jgi:hypothetical protein